MTRPHRYDGLDKNSMVTTAIPMRKLVEQVEDLNYGTHRFLSHLIDVRRERNARRIQTYVDRGDLDVAEAARKTGDPLADAIERLLLQGLY